MVDCLLCMSCFSSCFLVCDICFRCSCLAGRLSGFTNNFQKKSVFCSKLCFSSLTCLSHSRLGAVGRFGQDSISRLAGSCDMGSDSQSLCILKKL